MYHKITGGNSYAFLKFSKFYCVGEHSWYNLVMAKWTEYSTEKAQRTLEKAGAIPQGLNWRHVRNKLRLLGVSPETPNEILVTIVRKYEKIRESFPDVEPSKASEMAHKEYEIEQIDFDETEEIPIPELPEEVKIMAKEQLYEAPASATAKVKSPKGFEWLITTRDFTVRGVFDKVKELETMFENVGYTPQAGYSSTNAPLMPVPVCPDHGPMKESKKGKGWYCPTSVGENPQTGKKIYCAYRAGEDGNVYQ